MIYIYVCVCACVRARACVRVRVCVCVSSSTTICKAPHSVVPHSYRYLSIVAATTPAPPSHTCSHCDDQSPIVNVQLQSTAKRLHIRPHGLEAILFNFQARNTNKFENWDRYMTAVCWDVTPCSLVHGGINVQQED
jgi:hypothetical protein